MEATVQNHGRTEEHQKPKLEFRTSIIVVEPMRGMQALRVEGGTHMFGGVMYLK
jgi:hypothetical protein